MRISQRADNWQQAIEMASQPLLEKGMIEQSYIQSMIQSIHDNGPYIILQDYFALPHARAGEGVNQLGMSLLALDEPVDLLGNPVKIFVVLAAIDSTAHLEALAELAEILMEQDHYATFISGDLDQIDALLSKEKGGETDA